MEPRNTVHWRQNKEGVKNNYSSPRMMNSATLYILMMNGLIHGVAKFTPPGDITNFTAGMCRRI